jgi:hypothetical protein
MEDQVPAQSATQRDWGSIRDWMNVLAAVGALLVGIVSLWTTAQISGLEDYFRSEIARRNSDLDTLAGQSRRLSVLADERTNELAKLQTATDQLTASNLQAQGKLLSTQQELSKIGFEVVAAKQTIASSEVRLALLNSRSAEQLNLIDRFRRQRLFERAYMRIVYRGIWSDQNDTGYDGETVYKLIVEWPVGQTDADLAAYLPEFTANARSTCQWIRSYKPMLPKEQPYPKGPKIPGKPTGDGQSYRMSQSEYQQWMSAQDEWSRRFSEVSVANDRALKASQRSRDYLNKAAASCVCQALATAGNSASAICEGYEKSPSAPESNQG